jgi:hypothetical protein
LHVQKEDKVKETKIIQWGKEKENVSIEIQVTVTRYLAFNSGHGYHRRLKVNKEIPAQSSKSEI